MHKITKLNESKKVLLKEDDVSDYSSYYGSDYGDYGGGSSHYEGSILKGILDPFLDIAKTGKFILVDTLNVSRLLLRLMFPIRMIYGKPYDQAFKDFKEERKKIDKLWEPLLKKNKEVYKNLGNDMNIILFGAAPQVFFFTKGVKKLIETGKTVDQALRISGILPEKARESDPNPQATTGIDTELIDAIRLLFYGKAGQSETNESTKKFLKLLKEDKKTKLSDQEIKDKIYNELDQKGLITYFSAASEKYANKLIKLASFELEDYKKSKEKIQKVNNIIQNSEDVEQFVNGIKSSVPDFNVESFKQKLAEAQNKVFQDMLKKEKEVKQKELKEKNKSQKNENYYLREDKTEENEQKIEKDIQDKLKKAASKIVFQSQKAKILKDLNSEQQKRKNEIKILLQSFGKESSVKMMPKMGPKYKKLYNLYNELKSLSQQ